jgi:2-polyprenyl-6-hydroxyphenyl methylase / 3-demethylubiquinone-9 3-methyltransferase
MTSILDVGCGTGIFCELLAGHGAAVTGIDPAKHALAVATRRANAFNLSIDYRAEDVGDVRETFDVVTAMEVIEHVTSPVEFLQECALRVKPGGRLVLSTINRSIKSFAYAKVMGEYVLGLLPRGANQWKRFVRPRELETILTQLNFGDFVKLGVTLHLRSRELQLAEDCAVNYLFAAQLGGHQLSPFPLAKQKRAGSENSYKEALSVRTQEPCFEQLEFRAPS